MFAGIITNLGKKNKVDHLTGVFNKFEFEHEAVSYTHLGYYVDTAGKNAKKIQEYIQCQYEQDKAGEQLAMPNF